MITQKNKILYIPIGLPGCGKTHDRPHDAIIICKDDIRFMLLNYEQTARDYYLDKTVDDATKYLGKENLEYEVDLIVKKAFELLLAKDYNIYLDATNLKKDHRLYYISMAMSKEYDIYFIVYNNYPNALAQNAARKRRVPDKIIQGMMVYMEELTDFEISIAKNIKFIKMEE